MQALQFTISRISGMENLGFNISFKNSVTESSFKVIVVRHPLDRILSAYKYIFEELAGKFCCLILKYIHVFY